MNRHLLQTLRTHSRLRLATTLLCLLACTLQSFVAQTHIHAARSETSFPALPSGGEQAGAQSFALSLVDDDSAKHSPRDTFSTCPLCQVVLHGGAAPAPAFALSLPVVFAAAVTPAEQAIPSTLVAVSFSWQGRAPPLS